MSSAAKEWLAKTVRSLRTALLKELQDGLQETYRLSIPLDRAGLDLQRTSQRKRLEAWADEQARGHGKTESVVAARSRHLLSAVKQVGATWLNRLVVLGQMEALGLVRTPVLTGGWSSAGFREFREFAPALAASESEGYPFLLSLVFAELALDLPGLFGEAGLTALIPMPFATLRRLVEALQADALSPVDRAGLWRDDTLLGWVYQFWNDPEREALDEKIREGGKIENHEIAAKTQLFTDRYMVEWMLQNSLGQLWFAICAKNGWTPECVSSGVLDSLEARRVEWRGRRERGEVDLEELMPIEPGMEDRWKYWVPRELTHDLAATPASLAELRIFDPACGSGHFLVIAFDLLAALYEEEGRHRGVSMSREEIARSIVEANLHGLDIDPRAVQIAAAAVWLKFRTYAPKAELLGMNLVASNLGLASLPPDDPALVELVERVEAETGLPSALTLRIVETLKGADYLGSLLKVGEAVDKALEEHERSYPLLANAANIRIGIVERLEAFVTHHSRSQDLGLRMRGEQLAAGVRFIRIVREGRYNLIVGNPPYQGAAKMVDTVYLSEYYGVANRDMCTAFLFRCHNLLSNGGLCVLLTIRNWLFIAQFNDFRQWAWQNYSPDLLGDFDQGAFSNEVGNLLSIAALLLRKGMSTTRASAVLPTPLESRWRNDNRRAFRKEAATICGVGHHRFDPASLSVIPGQPLVYSWSPEFLQTYASANKIGDVFPARQGVCTGDNTRFLRLWWEVAAQKDFIRHPSATSTNSNTIARWHPFIKGAEGRVWFEECRYVVNWHRAGQEMHLFEGSYPKNERFFFRPGVAFTTAGNNFGARLHRFQSIFGDMGRSVFPEELPNMVCLMNASTSKRLLEDLSPAVNFTVGDVNRLPILDIEQAEKIVETLDSAFTQHEQARETSVEFRRPGPSPWTYAQQWAQTAVDRPAGTPLPEYIPVEEPEAPLDHLSFAFGVALGRFGANGEGILDEAPPTAIPHGILFLTSQGDDSLSHPAAAPLREHATYLRTKFFTDDHLKRYEKRPIYFPLSSEKKNFVAWTSIHRWTDNTLQTLLADYLIPEQNRLTAQLADLADARTQGDRKAQADAQKRYDETLALHAELLEFSKSVQQIAERGAPSPPGCPSREADAPFRMDLDDGVMINSAALWPLLLPHWKDPKTWWTDLCSAKPKKDYDWSHLAALYFPTRVDKKCKQDPSLAVAHGVFERYHSEKATQWQLRLNSEQKS